MPSTSLIIPFAQPRSTPSYVTLGNNLQCIMCPETTAQGFYSMPLPVPRDLDRSRDVFASFAFGKRTGTPLAPVYALRWYLNYTYGIGSDIINAGALITWTVPSNWSPPILEYVGIPDAPTPLIPGGTLPDQAWFGFALFRDPAHASDTYPTSVVLPLSLVLRYNQLCNFCCP